MNDTQLEILLLSARPRPSEYSQMTQAVMQQITREAVLHRQLRKHTEKSKKRGLIARIRMLHGAGLIIAIIAAVILITGAAYASVQFVPDLIRIIHKKQNAVGRIEYDVPGFERCDHSGRPIQDKFEISPAAHLSDSEVEKVLRAKCELMQLDTFVRNTWPTYGDHKEWKDGDHIYYTRTDVLGDVIAISKQTLTLKNNGGVNQTATYRAFNNQGIKAYSRDQQIDVNAIKPGDYVFSVLRVSEVYHSPETLMGPKAAQVMAQSPPEPLGLIAVVKMSLPEQYYTSLQKYVQPVVPCLGNTQERCSNGPGGVMIDIFPRGSEFMHNPYARADQKELESREINGLVTAINEHNLTIKAGSGTVYTVAIDKSVIGSYNTDVAPSYNYGNDALVRSGSWVRVMYKQKPNEDHQHIAVPDILFMQLMTGIKFHK